jgi:hypothetical protein
MSDKQKAVYGIDPYLDWVKKEGLPVSEGYGLDLRAADGGVQTGKVPGRFPCSRQARRTPLVAATEIQAGLWRGLPQRLEMAGLLV